MADRIFEHLHDGERVIWRAPQGSLVRENWFRWIVVLLIGFAFTMVHAALGDFTPMGGTLVGLAGCFLMRRSPPAAVAVTDRRALRLLEREEKEDEVLELDLREISAIAYRRGGLELATKAGGAVVFENPARIADFAGALARAAGLPEPPASGRPGRRLWTLEDSLFTVICLGALWFAFLGTAALFPGSEPSDSILVPAAIRFCLHLSGVLLWWGASTLACLAILSRFMARDELRALAWQSKAFAPNWTKGRTSGRLARLTLRFIDQLYEGQATQPEPEGNGHG